MRLLVVLLGLVASPCLAFAQEAPDEALAARCANSFPDRLADMRQAIAAYSSHHTDFEKSGAKTALEWFEAHCRFLTPEEIAIRKRDDENAFVCDPKAKGRPRNLTSELVLRFSTEPTFNSFQSRRSANDECFAPDREERITLAYDALPAPREQLEILCFGDERPICVKARAAAAAAEARQRAKEPQ